MGTGRREGGSPPLEIRVLRLKPCPRSAAHVARADPLRDNAFEAHSPMPKDGGPVAGDRLAELDAVAHGLLLRESSLLRRFLLQATRRCWLETYLMFQAFACTKELIE